MKKLLIRADILGKKMGKIGVYNFANIFVNKVWKNISFWILIAGLN